MTLNETATIDRATGEITHTPSTAPREKSDFERLLEQQQTYNARTMLDGDNMDKMTRLAQLMSEGKTTVPKHLQGSLGDCMAVVMQAMNWNMNAFAVAQKTHLVNGTLGYEAQLVIAVLNASPLLSSRINYEWFGDWSKVSGKADKSAALGVIVSATVRGETKPREIIVSMAQVGNNRNSPNWEADPRQQIAYLAAKRWGRLHAPDVILGVYTPDELEEGAMNEERPPAQLPRGASATQIAQAAATTSTTAAAASAATESLAQMRAHLEEIANTKGSAALADAWQKTATKADRIALGADELRRLQGLAKECDDLAAAAAAHDAAEAAAQTQGAGNAG